MVFRHYRDADYDAVCDFLIELCECDRHYVNWNWARFEWMAEHPEFDKSLRSSIGLWLEGERVVAAAIYDMYFGEAFCGVLPGYESLYGEVLDYAYRELRDENGLGIALCTDDAAAIAAARRARFAEADQTETVMERPLAGELAAAPPEGVRLTELDPGQDLDAFGWLLWQGFDHGSDRAEYEREATSDGARRRHFDPFLSLAAQDEAGAYLAYCCLWYDPRTDYAYVEPLCTIPSARGKGIARALVFEALRRARSLGAARAYVISDLRFYEKLGFAARYRYRFFCLS